MYSPFNNVTGCLPIIKNHIKKEVIYIFNVAHYFVFSLLISTVNIFKLLWMFTLNYKSWTVWKFKNAYRH